MSETKNIDSWMQRFGKFYNDTSAASKVMKLDAPMLSTTGGMFNAIHGRMAFTQFNQEANAWNALPKVPHQKSGLRLRTARGFTLGTGGVADAGSVADTVKSTVVEVTIKPKISHTVFEIGALFDQLQSDDVYGFDDERQNKAEDHVMDINQQLLTDLDTLAGVNFESIDRVCSNNSEATDATIALDAGDADIYGLDRDASTAYDAYVDHNSGVDRDLTASLIRTMINTIKKNSGKRINVILTGYDTYEKMIALYESQTRYMTDVRVSVGVNGVRTQNGTDVGLEIQAIMAVPVLQDDLVPVDTISRIYGLNTNSLKLSIALPTQYMELNDYLALGTFAKKAMYVTMGELWCENFAQQGKIRDLK